MAKGVIVPLNGSDFLGSDRILEKRTVSDIRTSKMDPLRITLPSSNNLPKKAILAQRRTYETTITNYLDMRWGFQNGKKFIERT